MKSAEILRTLAETLDIRQTLHQHRLQPAELCQIILEAAAALEESGESAEPSLGAPLSSPEEAVFPSVGAAELTLYTDGAARGNPGPAGAGIVIYEGEKMVEAFGQFLGRMTNNQAEYQAVILGLKRAQDLGARRVRLRTDSQLLVRQLSGLYQVKNPTLKKLFAAVQELIKSFASFEAEHVPRQHNSRADLMANRAIDEFQDER